MTQLIRRAVAADVPALGDILTAAFHLDRKPGGATHGRQMAEAHCDEFLVLAEEGELLAGAGTFRHWLQVGRCRVLKGDVGHVAVRPDQQGRGLGTALMQAVITTLREEGFHCSRLGGLMKFYRRFGYEPFPRRYVQIPVEPLAASMKDTTWDELLSLSPLEAAGLRPYDPVADHAGRHEVLARFNAGRPGALAPGEPGPPPAESGAPNPLALVYVHEGRLRGYLRGHVGPLLPDGPPVYQVVEFAVDEACAAAAPALLKAFLRQAASVAPTVVSCRLPYDERLFGQLTAGGVQFDLVEMRQGFDGNMMRVISLRGLIEAILPELNARWTGLGLCPWEGTVGLRLTDESVTLRLQGTGVSLEADTQPEATLHTDHATLLKWVLGLNGAGEYPWLTQSLTGPQRLSLSVLFPRLPAASGPWG